MSADDPPGLHRHTHFATCYDEDFTCLVTDVHHTHVDQCWTIVPSNRCPDHPDHQPPTQHRP